MDPDDLQLHTKIVGALPAINHFMERLHLFDILKSRLPARNDPDISQCIGILIRNILISREPLYGIEEWISGFPAELLGISEENVRRINDDRIGRSLERLFDTDRSSLMTEIVVSAVREFDLSMKRFHNDSTSVALSGLYRTATGKDMRMKRTVNLTFGHSKDHRKDLKQLVWILTVTADGSVPVRYRVADGNTNDSPTHIETWDSIRKLTGRSDFMYVADSKLCSDANLKYIDGNNGRFITVLPATWKEYGMFQEWIQSHNVVWEATVHGKKEDMGQVWKLAESTIPASGGFRTVWVWSSQKARHDKDVRDGMMRKSIMDLERLETKLRSKKCRLHSMEDVKKASEDAIGRTARRWVGFRITEEDVERKVQRSRGRPGSMTEYRTVIRKRFHVEWKPEEENIDFDETCDGMFPLITNDRKLSLKEILSSYKFQPHVEKRHEQLKSVYGVAPVMLKNVDRIEGFLFVYFLALLVESLIEREIRMEMAKEERKSIRIYPEFRSCESPTTDRVLGDFSMVQINWIEVDGKVVKKFLPKLTQRQEDLLRLAGVPSESYQQDWNAVPGG
ncbi:MAG: IS1634 family transposase [Candidatus Thermoplasmatota archaeon]|jgi:transposase|nr:IS1634 family transposase [Candidatus Thermoplasmatota archaeon]